MNPIKIIVCVPAHLVRSKLSSEGTAPPDLLQLLQLLDKVNSVKGEVSSKYLLGPQSKEIPVYFDLPLGRTIELPKDEVTIILEL